MTMPPLPLPGHKPYGYITGLFTADQMRAYGEACAAAERERCAKLCEDKARRHAKDADDNTKAQAWMMLICAAEIRAQGETP